MKKTAKKATAKKSTKVSKKMDDCGCNCCTPMKGKPGKGCDCMCCCGC